MFKISENKIRNLAKSRKYQFLYSRAKDFANLKLFNNETDFSYLQCLFLEWLEIYQMLYQDLASGEKNIDEEVIADHLRTEAYLVWKHENRKKQDKIESSPKTEKITPHDVPTVIFGKKRK